MKTLSVTLILLIVLSEISIAQEQLNINVEKSQIHWYGEYTFYFGGHDGLIKFKEGYFEKNNDVIVGGRFIIDMTSITCLDLDEEESKDGLVNHLKEPDFFDVANFNTSTLQIKSVMYENKNEMKIFADLTIKGITNPISFQAKVDYSKEQMKAKFKIDRMLWNVSYNSNMKDGAISDAIGFEVLLSL